MRNPDIKRACNRRYQARRVERNQAFLAWIRSNNACHDCGQWYDPVCMQFHHVEPGKYSVTDVHIPHTRLTEEIERCVLLCANCHCIRHKGEDGKRNKWDKSFRTNRYKRTT